MGGAEFSEFRAELLDNCGVLDFDELLGLHQRVMPYFPISKFRIDNTYCQMPVCVSHLFKA